MRRVLIDKVEVVGWVSTRTILLTDRSDYVIDGSTGATDAWFPLSPLFCIYCKLKFIVQMICVVRFLPMLCNIIIHSSKKNEKKRENKVEK